MTDSIRKCTQDNIEKFKSGIATLSPDARITHLQTCLDNLGDAQSQEYLDKLEKNIPEIRSKVKFHTDTIQTILSELNNYSILNWDKISKLEVAELSWKKILIFCDVLPKAIQGAAESKRMSDIASKPRNTILWESVKNLVEKYPDCSARELWLHLPDELENSRCELEKGDREEQNKIEYLENARSPLNNNEETKPITQKSISFRSFSNLLTKIRKEKITVA